MKPLFLFLSGKHALTVGSEDSFESQGEAVEASDHVDDVRRGY